MSPNSTPKTPRKRVRNTKRLRMNVPKPPSISGIHQHLAAQGSTRLMTQHQQHQSNQHEDYQREIKEFLSIRQSAPHTTTTSATSISAVSSQEMMCVRDESQPNPLPPIPETFFRNTRVDDEIEEGEIVENDVTEFVDNLLQESSPALERSRKIVDLTFSPPPRARIFYEDRSPVKLGTVPKYNTFASANQNEASKLDTSDDVICLDSSQPDDSVIFVSEEKLVKPTASRFDCFSSPSIVVPSSSNGSGKTNGSKPGSSPNKSSPKRRALRVKLWKEKKAMEFAGVNAANGKKTPKAKTEEPKPSTSSMPVVPANATKQQDQREKRIILIDGSNVAMGFTDNYGAKKVHKDFSAEGLKIVIDYFEEKGFQVKAIVPEFRVLRDRTSNHHLMNKLKLNGKLVLTPAKSYDDRVLLESALKLDAAVVSNDYFRDLLQEKPEYQEVVSRLIRFNWLFQKLIIPEDPHGRQGPTLDEILYKKKPS